MNRHRFHDVRSRYPASDGLVRPHARPLSAGRPWRYVKCMCRSSEQGGRLVALFSVAMLALSLAPRLRAAEDRPLSDFAHLVQRANWTEQWPTAAGEMETRDVSGEIWTGAMQAVLNEQGTLHIPARAEPYYLDGPLVLKSGGRLTADADAVIRLKPGTNTCMVRNAHVVSFVDRPVPKSTQPDQDIVIEGGIWTTLATSHRERNGNRVGASAQANPVFGTAGVILLHNVRDVVVRNITVRQSGPHAIHLGNARNFTVDGLVLDDTQRCGVQVEGPASEGVIRRIRGRSADDVVALNAWDWKNYAPSFGPIHHVLIEAVQGSAGDEQTPLGRDYAGSFHHDGAPENAIRMLPGVKQFHDGTTLDCPIHDITLRDISGIREFKMYDQPNLELGRENDASASIGTFRNIRFEKLRFDRPSMIELHANADGITIEDVTLNHPLPADWHLLRIGPKSQTLRLGGDADPTRWTEIFSPDRNCTVRNVRVSKVRATGIDHPIPVDRHIKVIELSLNPDYPQTTPRGGTGKGIWIRE